MSEIEIVCCIVGAVIVLALWLDWRWGNGK